MFSLPTQLARVRIGEENGDQDAVDEGPMIVNMQHAVYRIKIVDIQNRIERLKNRCNELSEEITSVEAVRIQRDAETAAQIDEVQRRLSRETREVCSLKETVQVLQDTGEQESEAHDRTVDLNLGKYRDTRKKLISAIKVLNAKINMLADFRRTQIVLREKLKLTQEHMQKNDTTVQDSLEKIRWKFARDTEMMKADLYKRVLHFAGVFQTELVRLVSRPVRRMMREKTGLGAALDKTWENQMSLENAITQSKSCGKSYKTTRKNKRLDARRDHISIKIQADILGALKTCHSTINKDASKQREETYVAVNIEEFESKIRNVNSTLARLKVLFHQESVKLSGSKSYERQIQGQIKKSMDQLCDARYLLKKDWERSNYTTVLSHFASVLVVKLPVEISK